VLTCLARAVGGDEAVSSDLAMWTRA